MYQNNRNLFPLIAVLTAASIIVGIFEIAFLAVDKLGGAPNTAFNLVSPDVVNPNLDQSLNDTAQAVSHATPTTATTATTAKVVSP